MTSPRPRSSNANDQDWQSDSASDSYPVEMDLTPDNAPNKTATPAPKSSRIRSPRREKLFNRSAKPRRGWSPSNPKSAIPPKLANRLKDRFRAEIVVACRAQHYEECRRDVKAEVDKELHRIAKENAQKLDTQRIKAEKALREARGERANELEKIRKLEQAKKTIESEAEIKDLQIRDLEANLQKSMATETDLKNRNATAERALRKALDCKHKAKQICNQRTAKEAALTNAAKEITDLQAQNAALKNATKEIPYLRAQNAALKKQIDDVKEDLKTSTNQVEDLETILTQPPPPTEANHQAKSIQNLTSSVDQFKSIVAEQAQSLANINSTMIDFKNVNETLLKELASQKSEKAAAEDKAAGLLEMFYAERQAKEDLEKRIQIQEADNLNHTAAAPAEAVPRTESFTAIIVQDDAPISTSSTLEIPPVASAPTSPSLRSIFDNLVLLAYYLIFGNLFLTFNLFSLVNFPGIQLFLSAIFHIFHTDISLEGEIRPEVANTDRDKKVMRIPGDWGWREED